MSRLELHKSESFQFGNLCPEIKCSNDDVAEATSRAGVVEPVVRVQETVLESGKQDDVPAVEVIQAGCHMARVVEPVLPVQETGPESGKQQENVAAVDAVQAEDQKAGENEPLLPVDETGWKSGNYNSVPAVESIHVKDQSTTKPVGNNR